jgi:hypothetical protein
MCAATAREVPPEPTYVMTAMDGGRLPHGYQLLSSLFSIKQEVRGADVPFRRNPL